MEKVQARTGIYHEHQQGYLCAQHALNNLLQDSVFSADILAVMARQLDAEEKNVLAQALHESENVDDTGFFNIQVLQRALATLNIELVPYRSQDQIALQARQTPQCIQAYICNLGAHWFAIRRFAAHYFNLNSIQYVPMIMPTDILKRYLNMIENNGYSVFIVSGQLPRSLADVQLETNPISSAQYEMLIKDLPKFIMDGKPVDDTKDFPRGRDILADIPPDLVDKYEQNPTDPQVREMLNAFLPEGVVLKGITRSSGCSDPTHHHCHNTRKLLIAPAYGHRVEKKAAPVTRPEKRDSMLSRQLASSMFDPPDFEESDELLDRSFFAAATSARMIFARGITSSPDGSRQALVLIQQSAGLAERLFGDSEEEMLRMIRPSSDFDEEDRFALQFEKDRRRLRAEGKSDEEIYRHLEDSMFQRLTDKAIAASLSTPQSLAKQSLEPPSTNSPPAITKEESIPTPPPLTNTNTISPPSPQNSTVTSMTNSHSSLPKATDLESPTVEELRQRRLQTHARKDRSIISSYVPSDDEIST